MIDLSRLSTRRAFLGKSLGLVSAGLVIPSWLDRTAFALDDPLDVKQPGARPGRQDDRILVVLQLSGGNDVLSSVVPYGDPEYYKARRVTAIRREEVLAIDDHLGLNRAMLPMKKLYDAGRMAIVQGVSYPNPNRSHFNSMAIWHTCDERSPDLSDGWLARYFEEAGKAAPVAPTAAISLGSEAPQALVGRTFRGISFQDPQSFAWQAGKGKAELEGAYQALNQARTTGNTELDFLSTTAMEANAATATVRSAVAKFKAAGAYQGRLGRDMATVAAMIAGGLDTRLYYVRQGGYDTHSGQRGRHDRLMVELAGNLEAFMTDLERLGAHQRVVVMCFSEFGRRVEENASGGTDHGAAGSMFVVGHPVKGGIKGAHPSLTALDRGDLAWSIDFRQVYTSMIGGWLGGPADTILGKAYAPIDLV